LKALSGREIALSIIAGVQGVLLEDITVTGAADLGIFSTPTAGLLIYGQADLDHIQISGNGRDGLFVGGSAAAWLVHSEISNNRGNGLTVSNLAQVAIKDSTISGSGLNGLNIRGSAQGALQDCQISGNAFQGIEVIDSATVSISDCRITDNRLNGLSINDSATVTLQSVQVSGNGQDGLYAARGFFGDSAVIIVQDSQVSSNEHDGLAIVQSARVRLFGNTVRDNKQYGIHPDSVANITACSANTATHNGINYNSAAAQKCNQ
jgi:parallel beta-helix repeat protein